MLGKFLKKGSLGDRYSGVGLRKVKPTHFDVVSISGVLAHSAGKFLTTKAYFSVLLALSLVTLSSPVLALGLGDAEVDSFIGQQLSVRIPMFNASAPSSLQIDVESQQFGEDGQAIVTAELDYANSQLAIKLSSDKVVNEPYLNFTLSLDDNNSKLVKSFTVLFNLPQKNSDRSSYETSETFSSSSKANVLETNIAPIPKAAPRRTMGPYEKAEAGNIPERFGAVLDGQSLWRVARRINSAMGVSRDQMMWALYQANPNAFSSQRVESLKAGTFLTIPSVAFVKRASDAQAKAKLLALSNGTLDVNRDRVFVASESEQNILGESSDVSISATDSQTSAMKNVPDIASAELIGSNLKASSGPFQVTSIDQSVAHQSDRPQSQMIITSLTETVDIMSQQLQRKDKEIEFLEQQVQELKSFINNERSEDVQFQGPIMAESTKAPSLAIEQALEANGEAQGQETQSWYKSLLPWLMLVLALLIVAIYAGWGRIQNLFYRLNLFGRQDNMEFSIAETQINSASVASLDEFESSSDAAVPFRVPALPATSLDVEGSFNVEDSFAEGSTSVYGVSRDDEDGFHQEASISYDGAYEYDEEEIETADLKIPNMDSANAIEIAPSSNAKADDDIRVVKQDLPEGVLNANYDESEMVEAIELLADEITARKNEEGLTFEQRFDHLLEERDFDFARELLDFARYNEINDERYHFERLRMLETMGDNDAFYEYYYSIEDELADFPQQIQTQISQLVVQMALN